MIAVKLYMIGFVDDTSGSTCDFLLPEPALLHHYANLATHDAQQRNDTLQLSGRVLEDSKCSYHFMYYELTRKGQPVLKGGTFDPTISIRFNDNTIPTPLKQLSAYTSHKMLGVYKTRQQPYSCFLNSQMRKMPLTQRQLAVVPSPTQMPGPTTMQYIYQALYILSPQAVCTAINVTISRNKLNKQYSLNEATIATLQTP